MDVKTQLGLGEATLRERVDPPVDPAIDHTLADPSGRMSAPLVGAARARAGDPERGDSIGRFVVLGVLGTGGMGVVYSAYDPHLDRKVAIKLLAHSAMLSTEDASIRLLREAQAMAKINHPNVVKVHEVGRYREQIYLAMEFADAGTLRGWLKDERAIVDILAVFTEAGRGLGAAHAVGLVHRDFKPDNVLMSKDGAVLVTDFGLVSSINTVTRAPTEPLPSLELSNKTPLSQDLTRTGSIMGTPTYMAPEQFAGEPSTAKTDQFSFCVALYEALYRIRPFGGTTYAELSVSVLTGELLPPSPSSKVPAWIRRVVVRGLATKPEQRHGSMSDLLAALTHDPGRRRRRILWSVVGGVVGAAVIGGAVLLIRQRGPECGTGDDRIAAVWSDNERAQISRAFMASNRPNAKSSFERTSQIVGDWNQTWKHGYVDACRATRERGEQSSHVLDLRMQCLTRRLDDMRQTLDLLAKGGSDAVDHALDAVLALPSVAPCSDAAGLTAAVAPPETAAMQTLVTAAREQLGTARVQRKLGRYKQGLVTARAALVAARATNYPPVVAEALIVVGTLQSDLADPASSATLAEAMHVATAAGDTVAAIDASAWRMFELTQTNHYELAQEVGELADAQVQHARPPAEIVVRLDNTSGLLLAKRGQMKPAQARYEQALALAQRELGPEHPAVLTTLNQLGNLYKQQGRFDDARKALEQVVAIRERVAGKDHPDVASALNNLGNVYRVEGKLDDAKQLYDRALAIRIAALGPEHPEVGTSLNNLGTFYSEKGDEVTAQQYFEKALALWERAYGKDSVELIAAIVNLGNSLNARGDHEGARAQYERARKLIETAHGPDHPDLAPVLDALGVVSVDEHHYEDALALYQRAQQITEKAYGPDHPDVADAMANITTVYKAMGKLSAAEEMTGRTITVIAKAYGPDHPRMGGVLVNYGALQMEQDKYAPALETYQKALAIFEAKLGKDHPYVAFASLGIGLALVELGRPAEAIPYEERALAIRIATHQPPELLAEVRFDLAEALVHDPRHDPRATARAVTEAKTSLGEYEAAQDDHDAGEVRAWLHKHH